jgi:antagonist of KipI
VLSVLQAGLLTTLQDSGRHGHAHLGVGTSGAADVALLRLANALVGNAPGAAALELTLVGPRLRFDLAADVAVVGHVGAQLDGRPLPAWRRCAVAAGGELEVGRLQRGARAYLAVGGGFDAAPVLGSRSTDLNAGIGPFGGRALRRGDRLGWHAAARRGTAAWSLDPAPWCEPDPALPLRLVAGAHLGCLTAPSHAALFGAEFRIAADSNRVGWRLDGPSLALSAAHELVSTGVVPGTLQLPPGGQPIVLGVEGPGTGGYPRLGHVASVDLARLAQRRPGDALRFCAIERDAALLLAQQREAALQRLETAIHARDRA